MKRYVGMCLVTAALLPVGAARAELKIMGTVPDLAALAKDIGGDLVAVRAMSLPSQDPHFVDAKPSLALELNRADLLLLVGLGLESGWLPPLLAGARNPRIQAGKSGYLDCSQAVHLLDVASGPIDRSQGDIHPGGNPHYMSDPRAGAAVARAIADRLGQLDPAHWSTFDANLHGLLSRLDALRTAWEPRLARHKGRSFIGYHRTWTYVASWLGLVEAGFLEPKPGIPPNPPHIAHLLGIARSAHVHMVLQEEYYPDGHARLIADKIPAVLVRVNGGTNFASGQTYPQRLERLLTAIDGGLGP